MDESKLNDYLNSGVDKLIGVGAKTKKILKRKKIEKISDLLWNIPQSFTDRSNLNSLDSLEIGKIATIKVKVIKYNFPRIRNLPFKVICGDEKGKIDIIFFNSREGYIRKILPINKKVVISGKINFFRNSYQITNPAYVVPVEKEDYVKKVIPKYSLTEGISEKIYRKIIEQVIIKIPNISEWHNDKILKKIGNNSWKKSLINIHENKNNNLKSSFFRRLAYDEILANFIVMSQVRKIIKKYKKKKKIFSENIDSILLKNFKFELTQNQNKIISEISKDLKSEFKMFRLLQGDVGSGKTIVAFVSAFNVIKSGYQVALMAPTEILAKQHYKLAKKIFNGTKFKIDILTGKTNYKDKKKIINDTKLNKIDILTGKTNYKDKKKIINDTKLNKINFIIGTHSLFQKNVFFKKLGLIIIDEQHKFGVKQRIQLSSKGGKDCDILLLSATPIPRTLILSVYGDMDVSRLIEKPKNRKNILTLSKPEEKINEILFYVSNEIKNNNQVFWICPLIDESTKLDYSAAKIKYDFLSKKFGKKVGLIHGSLQKDLRDKVLKDFSDKKIDILVSTTVVEVGIDFPNANIIIIENSNKFGLSQLHQLRGRVGRSEKQGICFLLYKKNLSTNAKKRIRILKESNDGFYIAEEDMKLRGFGDVLGYQQSGIKNFKLADPLHHKDLFEIAEQNIKDIESNERSFERYKFLLKLFDKADILSEINP